jgi:sodium-dependent phosphate transporter
MGWPVSTTYSIVSAVAGVGIAAGGFDAPNWGWNGGKGLGAIFGGLVIAPALAAGFAAVGKPGRRFGRINHHR